MSLVVRIGADLSEFNRGMKDFNRKVNGMSSQMESVGQSMVTAGTVMTAAVTLPLVALGTASVGVGADFESSMNVIHARTGMAGDDVYHLGLAFRDMAVACDLSSFSAREVADAFSGVAVRGQTAEDATNLMSASMVLATAVGEDLSKTAYFIGNYLLKVGKDASYAEKTIDVFALAVANTGISLGDMQNYVFRMTPAFEMFGASTETNIAIMSRLYQAGIRGANLYSGMGDIMMQLATQSGHTAGVIEMLGLCFDEMTAQGMDNTDMLFHMADAMGDVFDGSMPLFNSLVEGGMEASEALEYMATAMGEYSDATELAAFIANDMTNAQAAALFEFVNLRDELRDEVIPAFYDAADAYDGIGIAAEMAGIKQYGLSASAQRLRASFEEIKLIIADHLMPHVQRFADRIKELMQRFKNLSPETQQMIIRFAGIAAAIGPLLIVGGKLLIFVAKLKKAFAFMATPTAKLGASMAGAKGVAAKLGVVFGALGIKILPIIAIVGSLVGAFVNLWRNNEEFRDGFLAIWERIRNTFSTLIDGIVERVNALGFDFENFMDILRAVGDFLSNVLGPTFTFIFETIAIVFDYVVNKILSILDVFIGVLTGDWERALEGVVNLFVGAWTFIKDFFGSILTKIGDTLNAILAPLGITWQDKWGAIRDFFVSVWNSIKDFFANILNAIVTVATGKLTSFLNLHISIHDAIRNAISSVWSAIQTFFISKWNSIVNFAVSIFTSLLNVQISIQNSIRNAIQSVWNAIKSFFSGIFNAIRNTTTSIWTGIKSFFSNTFSSIHSTISGAMSNISSSITGTWNNITSFLRNINLFDIGRNIIQGLVNGIRNMMSAVTNAVSDIAGRITSGITSALRIFSPSRVMIKLGEYTGEGLVIGLKKCFADIDKVAASLVDKVLPPIPKMSVQYGANLGQAAFAYGSGGHLGGETVVDTGPTYLVLNGKIFGELIADDVERGRGIAVKKKMALRR